MANAMKILGDSDIIYDVFKGLSLKFYKTDDELAVFIKKYINEAATRALNYHDEYEVIVKESWKEYHIKHQRWIKRGMNGPSPTCLYSHYISDSRNLVELKVNHYRQKFWYWKKLKE